MADQTPRFVLQLFIADDLPKARMIAEIVTKALETRVPGRYEFTIINVLDHPEEAVAARVFATPMLIRVQPLPSLRVVGELADADKVLELLRIEDGEK